MRGDSGLAPGMGLQNWDKIMSCWGAQGPHGRAGRGRAASAVCRCLDWLPWRTAKPPPDLEATRGVWFTGEGMACGSEGCSGRWSSVALADLDQPPDVGLLSVCESPLATVGGSAARPRLAGEVLAPAWTRDRHPERDSLSEDET